MSQRNFSARSLRNQGCSGWRRAFGLMSMLVPFLVHGNAPAEHPETRADTGSIPAVVIPQRDPVSEYLDTIDRVEGEYGPYAPELSDLYLGLAQTMLDRSEYEQARDAINRGLMVMRVNVGPRSAQQTDSLYLLANVEMLLGNETVVEQILSTIYLVNADQYGEESPEMLPVLERMRQWYLATHPPGAPNAEYFQFVRVIEMSQEILAINELHHGPGSAGTAAANRRLGEAEFMTVRYLLDQGIEFTLDSRMDLLSRTMDTEGGHRVSLSEHYYAGRAAFREYLTVVEADASKTPLEHANAYANLGDWYLGVGKFRNARQYYEQAYRALAQSEAYADEAERYMAQPRPVHFFQPPPDFLAKTGSAIPELHLEISMTVTRSGKVISPQILNAPEDLPDELLGDILRLVRSTPFRPAMKAGDLVTTEDFAWHFSILPRVSTS